MSWLAINLLTTYLQLVIAVKMKFNCGWKFVFILDV